MQKHILASRTQPVRAEYTNSSMSSEELDIFKQAPRGVAIKDIERKRAQVALYLSTSTKPVLRRIQRWLKHDDNGSSCSCFKSKRPAFFPLQRTKRYVNLCKRTNASLSSPVSIEDSNVESSSHDSDSTNATSRLSESPSLLASISYHERLAKLASIRVRTAHLNREYAELQEGINQGRIEFEECVVKDTLRVLGREFEGLEAEWREEVIS